MYTRQAKQSSSKELTFIASAISETSRRPKYGRMINICLYHTVDVLSVKFNVDIFVENVSFQSA